MQGTVSQEYKDLLEYLTKENFENPELQASLLFEHVCGKENIGVENHASHTLRDEELRQLRSHYGLLKKGLPVQRQIGRTRIRGLNLKIAEDVLLPGPEIEALLDACIDYLKVPTKIAELGVGCGVVSIFLVKQYFPVMVYCIDISPAAIAVAREMRGRTKSTGTT